MTEQISPIDIENESSQVEKALIIMYPDNRTTGGFPLLPGETHDLMLPKAYYDFAGKYMDRYKREGYTVFGIGYADSTDNTRSQLYPYDRFDSFLKIDTPLSEWRRESHPQLLQPIIDSMNLKSKSHAVVGGYHTTDCVATMIKTLRKSGHQADVNLLLTDELGLLLVSHRVRSALRELYSDQQRIQDREVWNIEKKQIEERLLTS